MNDRLRRALSSRPETGDLVAAAVDRFSEAATQEGLVDVATATVDSPIGPLLLASTPRGLIRIAFDMDGFDDVLRQLATRVSPRIVEVPGRLDAERRELAEYFEGRRNAFEIPIDWSELRGFRKDVLKATAGIPYGATATYKAIATSAGDARAARAAGNALGSNPVPIVVPCHRVVRTGGGLGGYGGGIERKRYLLALEGALQE